MLDFPRQQLFVISILLLILLVLLIKRWKWYNMLLCAGLIGGLLVNGSFLMNYTTLVPIEVPTVKEDASTDTTLGILIVNVKMSNKNARPLLHLLETVKPDIILAMEVDQWWNAKLKTIEKEYPHSQETINEVAYGMTLYSKFPLEGVAIDYLQNKKVPSFECIVTLPDGRGITFHAVHPVPPKHFKNLPDNAGQEETALQKLGRKVEDGHLPTIVAGDLNDAIWSYIDDLTDTEDILHDVRTGRGFYNSYGAEALLMRWPLDHVFVTREFKLKTLERMPKIGSDHFPIYVELALAKRKSASTAVSYAHLVSM